MSHYLTWLNETAREMLDVDEDRFTSLHYGDIIDVVSAIAEEKGDTHAEQIVLFVNRLILETNKLVAEVGVTYDVDDFILNGLPTEITDALDSLDLSNIYENNSKVNDLYQKTMNHFIHSGSHIGALPASKARGDKYALGCSFLAYGYRLDSDSIVQPDFIRDSLFDGFQSETGYYNAALSSRNALLQAVNAIPDSGYIYRKLSQLLSNSTLDTSIDYCGSTVGVEQSVPMDHFVYPYEGRYAIHKGELLYLGDEENHKKFKKGDVYNLLSPITCRAPGKSYCRTCVGDLANGIDKYDSTGIISGMEISEKNTQTLLSSKHLQFLILSFMDHYMTNYCEYNHEKQTFVLTEDITQEESNHLQTYEAPFVSVTFTGHRNKGQDAIVINDSRVTNIDMNSLLAQFKRLIECHVEYRGISDFNYYRKLLMDFLFKSGLDIDPVHFEVMISNMCRVDSDPSKVHKELPDEPYTVQGLSASLFDKSNTFDLLIFERVRETLRRYSRFNKDDEFSVIENFFINGAKNAISGERATDNV